jgi:transcriptional regulator with XRE-family HTH domain
MNAKINKRKDEHFVKEEVFKAALKLQLAELGYMLPPGSVPDEERFAHLLKCVRQHRGLSKAQLAKLTDVTEATISRLERGLHTPQERTIVDLARALDVSPEYLQPERVFSEWVEYAAQVRKRLGELLARDMLKDLELERVVSEWDEDRAAVRNRLGPAAVCGRLGYLNAREIVADRGNRAAIEREKAKA